MKIFFMLGGFNSFMDYFLCSLLSLFLPSLLLFSQFTITDIFLVFSYFIRFCEEVDTVMYVCFPPLLVFFYFFFTKFNYINDVDFNSSSFFI